MASPFFNYSLGVVQSTRESQDTTFRFLYYRKEVASFCAYNEVYGSTARLKTTRKLEQQHNESVTHKGKGRMKMVFKLTSYCDYRNS